MKFVAFFSQLGKNTLSDIDYPFSKINTNKQIFLLFKSRPCNRTIQKGYSVAVKHLSPVKVCVWGRQWVLNF